MPKLQLNEQKRHQRELAEHLREKDKADLRLLRAQINSARVARRNMLHLARLQCRDARVGLKHRQQDDRLMLRAAHQSEREEAKTACEIGKKHAKTQGAALERTAKRTLKEEREFQRQIREAGRKGASKVRSSARERAAEDDDAVRSNLPAELVPVFNAVARKLKFRATPTRTRTRTEAFLDWAEENPDEILNVQQAQAEKDLKALLKQQRALGGEMRKASRYKGTAAELEQLLAAVPF